MYWEETGREERGFCLTGVRFTAEDEKRERRHAQTMNRFYEALEQAAEAYARECQAVSEWARYVCRICASAEEGDIYVTVTLSLRLPGTVSRRNSVCHRWRDGVLQEESIL